MKIYKNLEKHEAKKLFKTVSRVEDFVDVTLDVTNTLMFWNGNPKEKKFHIYVSSKILLSAYFLSDRTK